VRASRLLFRGQRDLRAGRPAEALEFLSRAAVLDSHSPHVALHRALALADSGQLDEALHALQDAASRWPRNPVFPLFLGALLAEHDRLDEALSALAAARKLSPHNLLAEAYEALVAMRRGSIEAPLRRLGVVGLTDNPRALAAILTEVETVLFRRFGTDTDGHPPKVEETPPSERLRCLSAARLAARGLACLERDDPAGAWPLLLLAAEKNPSLPDLFAHLGFAAFDLGRHEQALDYLGRVGEWSSLLDAVYLHRGACLYRLGRFAEAIEALQAAGAADTLGNYAAWIRFYLARTLIALGRGSEARPHFRALLDLEGDLALARLRQARELLGLAVPESAPIGFEVIEDGTTTVVKPAYAEAVRQRRPAAGDEPPKAGRAPMERLALPDGVALVRRCRRGGLLGRFLGDTHFNGRRFLREIALSDALRRRGIPTPEAIGGVRREVIPGVYRAEILTREVPGSLDLAAALRTLPPGEAGAERKRELLAAAARLLRQMHDAGLWHADLNARNILIIPDGSAMILDLDRAELLDELPFRGRAANLARLYRSLHKLGLAPAPVGDADWGAFYRAYAADDRSLLDRAEAVMGRCRRELARHRFAWRLTGASVPGGSADEDSHFKT
jgi:tetratricopeptide (TPR) repeat protein